MKEKRYCLCVPIPYFYDDLGHIWLDELWYHDLVEHLRYLPDLTVLAPCAPYNAVDGGNLVQVPPNLSDRLQFTGIGPELGSMREAGLRLPSMIRSVWRAVQQADIVHSGIAGWPIPLGFVVNPVAVFLRRPLIIVIESAFWRIPTDEDASVKRRVRSSLTEVFARWSLRRARLAIYTHSAYQDTLPVGRKGIGAVIPASWIAASDIITEADLSQLWASKTETVRFLFPSRLTAGKGAQVVVDAIRFLEDMNRPIVIDIIGNGDMREAFESLADEVEHVRLRILDPVPYGEPFLALLRDYHAVIVPTVGDEQPRIIFDAFSQGIPVIASDTPGNIEVVIPGQNGVIFPVGQVNSLASMLVRFSEHPNLLRDFAIAARETAKQHTHTDMHRERAMLLNKVFGSADVLSAL